MKENLTNYVITESKIDSVSLQWRSVPENLTGETMIDNTSLSTTARNRKPKVSPGVFLFKYHCQIFDQSFLVKAAE